MMLATLAAAVGAVSQPAAPVAPLSVSESPRDATPYTQPDWRKRPNADELRAVWPGHAWRAGLSGRAEIRCMVNVRGLTEDCAVVSEAPAGEGFGAAALLLTPNFLFTPARGPAGPVRSSVNIPINFRLFGVPGGGSSEEITMVLKPVWAAAPSFADLGRVYPRGGGGLSGHVVLRCGIDAKGALATCATLTEDPAGKGFDRAARSLINRFRLSMDFGKAKNGEATYINLPIRLIDPQSADFQARRIGDPRWIVRPGPGALAAAFPQSAIGQGAKGGRGFAACTVAADGALIDCTPLSDQSDSPDFARAAVLVAQLMRMNIWTDEGGPIDGAPVRIPIRFEATPPPAAAPPAPPKP